MKKNYIAIIAAILIAVAGCEKDQPAGKLLPVPSKEKKWIVSTIAGDGTQGFADGPALSAKFNAPIDVAVAADGTLLVTDFKNHRIRKIAAGRVSTVAGNANFGIVNGNGVSAQFKTRIVLQ
jgi:glucose/arabinose dehydrogenase